MSGPWHPTGRARVSARRPQALGVCDRCGFVVNHKDLRWQFEYQGMQLQNLNILVCDCYDIPNPNLKTIVLPPDPLPVLNPRPEPYSVEVPNYRVTEDGGQRVTMSGDKRVTMESGDVMLEYLHG